MAKSIKLKNDTYWDTSGIAHNKQILKDIIIVKDDVARLSNVVSRNLFAYNVNAFDKTSSYRSNAPQRLILSFISMSEIKFSYNGGNYSFGYIEIPGIDGTKDYSISYKISENTTSYSPYMSIDKSNSTSDKLMILINGGNGSTIVATSNYFVLKDIQLEEGSTATSYVPYLNLEELQENRTIVESSNNDDGYYIKYIDGTMICQGTKLLSNINANIQWGGLYVADITNPITFPKLFTDTPTVTLTVGNESWNCIIINSITTNDKISKISVARNVSSTGMQVRFNYIAIGRWK